MFRLLPVDLGLILVSTMMAIIVSTADSFLLIPATNLTRDVYQRYIHPGADEKQVLLSRCVKQKMRLLLTHDPGCAMCSVALDEDGRYLPGDELEDVQGLTF